MKNRIPINLDDLRDDEDMFSSESRFEPAPRFTPAPRRTGKKLLNFSFKTKVFISLIILLILSVGINLIQFRSVSHYKNLNKEIQNIPGVDKLILIENLKKENTNKEEEIRENELTIQKNKDNIESLHSEVQKYINSGGNLK